MKKLDESVLRRLILETIDEQAGVLVEGKKKKKRGKDEKRKSYFNHINPIDLMTL